MPPGMKVATFCYGSYMDPDVLRRFGATPGTATPARLPDHRLVFSPHANVRPEAGHDVHGFVFELPHAELDKLYGPNGYVTSYRPVPVVVHTDAGTRPALTFVEEAEPTAPDGGYLQAFLAICHRLGLPPEYVAEVERTAGVATA